MLVKTSHVIMMASDMETDPAAVPELIRQARLKPDAVITASRWHNHRQFKGYQPLKLVLNYIFQVIVRTLYRTTLTDATFGYRLFPAQLVQRIRWEELRHPFLLETILKPLLLGVPIIEIPVAWEARSEGVSQNPFFRNFDYFRILFKYKFYSRNQLVKE